MFEIRKHIEIDMGHRVPFHGSKCRRIHGHRYRVTIIAGAPETQKEGDQENPAAGMVCDFGDLKKALVECVDQPYDHQLVLWDGDEIANDEDFVSALDFLKIRPVLVPVIPTAEELARFWGNLLFEHLAGGPFTLIACEVMETPTSVATYHF